MMSCTQDRRAGGEREEGREGREGEEEGREGREQEEEGSRRRGRWQSCPTISTQVGSYRKLVYHSFHNLEHISIIDDHRGQIFTKSNTSPRV